MSASLYYCTILWHINKHLHLSLANPFLLIHAHICVQYRPLGLRKCVYKHKQCIAGGGAYCCQQSVSSPHVWWAQQQLSQTHAQLQLYKGLHLNSKNAARTHLDISQSCLPHNPCFLCLKINPWIHSNPRSSQDHLICRVQDTVDWLVTGCWQLIILEHVRSLQCTYSKNMLQIYQVHQSLIGFNN